jgi:hypothetical protein
MELCCNSCVVGKPDRFAGFIFGRSLLSIGARAARTKPKPAPERSTTTCPAKNRNVHWPNRAAAERAIRGHFLDDQNKAKQFAGKNVKVTGTLDATNNTIHVTDIQLA